MKRFLPVMEAFVCCSLASLCLGQEAPPRELSERAQREFRNNDWPTAERDFRELVKRDPSNVFACMYLGQTLFRQEKYGEAATVFQKTRDLQKRGKELNTGR